MYGWTMCGHSTQQQPPTLLHAGYERPLVDFAFPFAFYVHVLLQINLQKLSEYEESLIYHFYSTYVHWLSIIRLGYLYDA
mgnify:CR=1 FL=1